MKKKTPLTSPDASILERAIWTSSSVMSRSKSFSQSSLTSVLEPGDGGERHNKLGLYDLDSAASSKPIKWKTHKHIPEPNPVSIQLEQ